MLKYQNIILICFLASLIGCQAKTIEVKKTYKVSKAQEPLPKVYYPGRWVRPPEPPTTRNYKKFKLGTPKIIRKFYYDLPNSNLAEAAAALATSMKYSSYCASKLRKQSFSIQNILTPMELAEEIENKYNINIVFDELNREVRFLESKSVPPKFGF